MLEILHTNLHIGISSPVRILHITDSHMTFTDKYDSDDHRALEKERFKTFYNEGKQPPFTPDKYFEESIEFAEKNNALIVCTGDMMDIQTHGNAEAFRRITAGHDMMFTPGGHEHQKRCVRTMEEADGYWMESRRRLSEILSRFNLDFESRICSGLNIITADNSLDYYNQATYDSLMRETERGLPIILFGHDPINDEYLNKFKKYHPNVTLSGKEFDISRRTIELIQNNPNIKAFFGGHNHTESHGLLKNGNPYFVTPGLFYGICRLIEID